MPPPCRHDPPRLPDPPWSDNYCRLCLLYATEEEYRALWDGQEGGPPVARSRPCLFLGEVISQLDCPCPGLWLRACAVHKVCTLARCKTCPDYQDG
jgi:hypothetical protein